MGAGNTINYVSDGSSYQVCGRNKDGGHVFYYDSTKGGPVKDAGSTTLNDTCAYTAG